MKNQDARKLNPKAQETIRLRLTAFLKSGKGTQKQAADIFKISLPAVEKIWKQFRQGGYKALKAKKRGPHSARSLLSKAQANKIILCIKRNTPDGYKLPYFLWTADAVGMLIKMKTGLNYSVRHVRRLLKWWGFTPQKPAFRAYEQNPRQVRKWIEQQYPRIKQKAKRQHGLIFWEDETGMRSQHQRGTSFSPKGKTPVIKRTGQHFNLNMISAVSNQGQLSFMIVDGKFNGAVFLEFLRHLISYRRQKVFLIADRHPVHMEKKVMQWLKEHQEKIEMFLLPPYSPELNPDEYFNQDLKTNFVGKARPKNKEDLKTIVKDFVKRKQRSPQTVKRYFNAQKVRYAA